MKKIRLRDGRSHAVIAKEYAISNSMVAKIKGGRAWTIINERNVA